MADDRRYWLRKGDAEASSASFPELFFDLVFVFALIQLSETLVEDFTFGIASEAVLFILALWWVWIHTTWVTNLLDSEIVPVRILPRAVFGIVIVQVGSPTANDGFAAIRLPAMLAVHWTVPEVTRLPSVSLKTNVETANRFPATGKRGVPSGFCARSFTAFVSKVYVHTAVPSGAESVAVTSSPVYVSAYSQKSNAGLVPRSAREIEISTSDSRTSIWKLDGEPRASVGSALCQTQNARRRSRASCADSTTRSRAMRACVAR